MILDQVIDRLLTNGIIDSINPTTGTGWIGVTGVQPTPDTIVAALPVGGRDPNPAWNQDYPHVQIIVRGNENALRAAYNKAWEVRQDLLGVNDQDVNGDIWAGVRVLGDITNIGNDKSGRPMVSLNFEFMIHSADLGNRSAIA